MYINGWTRDKVMKRIRERNLGFQAADDRRNCFYRQNVNGQTNCCLVGAFIPDNKYREGMEKKSVTDILDKFDLRQDMPMNLIFMKKLQVFHDNDLDGLEGEGFFEAIKEKLVEMEKQFN